MGWEALGQWGDDVVRIEPVAGGVPNDVWSVRVSGHASAAWEAAVYWDDEYAVKRLAEVRAV